MSKNLVSNFFKPWDNGKHHVLAPQKLHLKNKKNFKTLIDTCQNLKHGASWVSCFTCRGNLCVFPSPLIVVHTIVMQACFVLYPLGLGYIILA